ncbi:hypothetical protein YERSI8AC_220109 [Enterobacterales bacterium 8AC]|nr:hypothetical protein YERSI8AC_220109 [Enterobacterales bacterium 8AC]
MGASALTAHDYARASFYLLWRIVLPTPRFAAARDTKHIYWVAKVLPFKQIIKLQE